MILPALTRGGYQAVKQQTIGTRCGGGTHKVDAIATRGDDRILVSLKWQQTGGTWLGYFFKRLPARPRFAWRS